MDWDVLISAIGVLIALGALAEAIRSRRKAERSARHADIAAQKSADAAERSATAAEQTADALQRSTRVAEAEAAAKERVTWTLAHLQGDAYLLQNESRFPAYDVIIDIGDLGSVRDDLKHAVIEGGEPKKFMATRSMATKDDTVVVSWFAERVGTRPNQKRDVWRHPIPAKPRQ